ncbi:hypothetical protein HHL11_07065 [Ramlibacter sp. G-1-2-2]|uniref:Uncharacterized protein n=1 Tax=Ramlibacter agri TaxID=2728837 RepID=A0A848H1J2_9BURK|nr:hypothetical protein [Ramlibacter agri]NML43502.1 hypothetical protein [Ramlibacter agri]
MKISTFKKVIQEHRAAVLAAAEAKRLGELQKQEAQRKFASSFAEVAGIARPIFERFVAELQEEGLQAVVDMQPDESGNPAIAMRFSCNPENVSGPDCMFRLAGDVAVSKVQRITRVRHDDPGSGAAHELQSINPTMINQQLAEALRRGLKEFAA